VLGARIDGIGTSRVTVHGGQKLGGGEYRFDEDFHEITTFLALGAITDGDVVVRLGDRSVAMMCGGLFFPGDMEVVGERLRAQVYQACQVLFNVDHLTIVVAGALMAAGEDIGKFLTRGASARFHATAHRRTDVLIDYVSHSLSR